MSKSKYIYYLPLLLLFMAIWTTGCKKLIDIPVPNNQLVSSAIFLDSIPAQSAMNGLYSQFYSGSGGGSGYYSYNITLEPARLADEMYAVSTTFDDFTNNSLLSTTADVNYLWNDSYAVIYSANSIIEGLQNSTTLSASLKQQLTGEAKFIRALTYFYLVNLYGDVPLVTTTNVTVNATMPRTASSNVYAQIIADLTDARNTLANDYSWSQGNRTRANSWAASALLARVYLYQGKWPEAEAEATKVINHTSLFNIAPLENVFLKNSSESILSFYTNSNGFPYLTQNTYLTGTSLPNYALRDELLNAFELGDARSAEWIGNATYNDVTYKYPAKYKSHTNDNTEYQVCLRLSEQYLIRAEARMQQNNITGAQDDLYVIRHRAGLDHTTANDVPSLKLAIEHERQVEMFYEWGERWLDLKRTGRADVVLRAEKPAGWQVTDVWYPIPLPATSTNSNLVQNAGYN